MTRLACCINDWAAMVCAIQSLISGSTRGPWRIPVSLNEQEGAIRLPNDLLERRYFLANRLAPSQAWFILNCTVIVLLSL